jgi:hypothetical protein
MELGVNDGCSSDGLSEQSTVTQQKFAGNGGRKK